MILQEIETILFGAKNIVCEVLIGGCFHTVEHEVMTRMTALFIELFFFFFIAHQESGTVCTEGKAVTQNQTASEESAAVSQEEQLTNLENEVASIKSKMKDCTQEMLDAQNALAKVTNLGIFLTLYTCIV